VSSRNLAILQTIVATCRLNDVLPYESITDVVVRVETHPATKLDDLLPMNWRPVAQQGSYPREFPDYDPQDFPDFTLGSSQVRRPARACGVAAELGLDLCGRAPQPPGHVTDTHAQQLDGPRTVAEFELAQVRPRNVDSGGQFGLADADVIAKPLNDVPGLEIDVARGDKVAPRNKSRGSTDVNLFVGRRVQAERKRRRLTQMDLATSMGISRPYLTQLETGARTWTIEHLMDASDALGVDPADLISEPVTLTPDEAAVVEAMRQGGTTAAFIALSDVARKK
jgi:transcriptional regulator with XRE-family HTH domain